jgi:hypothetical protein
MCARRGREGKFLFSKLRDLTGSINPVVLKLKFKLDDKGPVVVRSRERIYEKGDTMFTKYILAYAVASFTILSGCAVTKVQPLTKNSFSVSTAAAPACGQAGASMVANRVASIEVIKRGGDRFFYTRAQSDYRIIEDSLIVQMVTKGDPGYSESFSAREELGADWQEIVVKGIPNTCTN